MLAAWGGVAAAWDVVCSAGVAVVATAGSLVLASRFQSQALAGPAAKAKAAKVVTTRSFVMAGLLLKHAVLYHDRDRPDRSRRSRNRKLGPIRLTPTAAVLRISRRSTPCPRCRSTRRFSASASARRSRAGPARARSPPPVPSP